MQLHIIDISIINERMSLITAILILAITSFILKKKWYDKLTD
jgi:hypothetical protein